MCVLSLLFDSIDSLDFALSLESRCNHFTKQIPICKLDLLGELYFPITTKEKERLFNAPEESPVLIISCVLDTKAS